MDRQDEIKLIAYRIWEEEGCQHGHDFEHWLKAEVIWENRQKAENKEFLNPEISIPNAISAKVKTARTNKTPIRKFNRAS